MTIDEEIQALTDERKALWEKKEPIDKRLIATYDRLQELNKQKQAERRASNIKLPLAEIMQCYDKNGQQSTYDDWKEFLKTNQHLGISSCSGGYWVETNQYCLQICINCDWTDAQLEASAKFLTEMLDVILPHKPDTYKLEDIAFSEKVKTFDILEHTLSEFGSYHLDYSMKTGEFLLTRTNYGRPSLIQKSSSLLEMLALICDKHYYQETSK